ncbi:serine/threonine protein kinase [Planctomycetes bacterium TBK1r]|uniref:Serine/threonine-protein kinase PknB n=1 Tax=Stieleria magnilauensis TaxID=2527963 RepID=A0ABX5Y5J0_9BACT|nr:Serine/threonine-protein kinase PknB [Planctomycetes bacterium TBK1r]
MSDSTFEDLCDQFEASWQAGQPLSIRRLLKKIPSSQRTHLLKALLEIELEYRFQAEEQPTPKDYPFPGLDAIVALAFAETRRRIKSTVSDLTPSKQTDATQEALGLPGRRIGPFKLLKKIGEDELVTVYMAEQQKPMLRTIALNIVQADLDHAEVVSRFNEERQLLSMLVHPHIAKVLDADTTDSGRSYFVTEFIDGDPITRFCDQFRLNMKKRLQLFIQSCDAVQHGNQKGVLHRDLRPDNVLIEQHGRLPTARVINFGLARALRRSQLFTEETRFTRFDQAFVEFQYVSPEHLRMNASAIDSRSDVYSLGALLYELITGTTPIHKVTPNEKTLGKYLTAIQHEETPRPSLRLKNLGNSAAEVADNRRCELKKLIRLLRGDLDRIAIKALQKKPERRYGDAGELADDIRRFLAAEPVRSRRARRSSQLRNSDTEECGAATITQADDALERHADLSCDPESLHGILSPPQEPDEIGRLGNFRIEQVLGAGGMGFVFLATTPESKDPIALKVMNPAIAQQPNAVRRFLREGQAAKQLRHPNIVKLMQSGDINGTPYITMEYLRGQSLQSAMRQYKTFAQTKIIQFAKEIASGLAFAHSRDLVHRDIKPSNLWIVSPPGSIKILDFGLVRDVSLDHVSLTDTGVVVGSPKYMSPEQVRGEKVGAPSDLFSMGSILYRLATGKHAFDEKNVTSTLLSIAKDDPVPISKVCPEFHVDFANLIHRLLMKDPRDRPQSASNVYHLLLQLENQLTAPPPVVSPSSKSPRAPQK